LAECYCLRKEWDSASIAFTGALAVQRDARAVHDKAAAEDFGLPMPPLISDESIADTLKRLGKSHASHKRYEEAGRFLLEALFIFQSSFEKLRYLGRSDSGDELADKQDDVAQTLYCIAEVNAAAGKHDETIKLYEESLQLRLSSDSQRLEGKKTNMVYCAMCLAGIGSVRMRKKEYKAAYKVYSEALEFSKDMPQDHPIVQVIWKNSIIAAKKVVRNQKRKGDRAPDGGDHWDTQRGPNVTRQATPWHYTVAKLENKAQSQKKKGDVDGAIKSTRLVLDLYLTYLSKREEGDRDTSKAQHNVARTLINLARLLVLKDETQQAAIHYKEAMHLYSSSGTLTKDHVCVREIQGELDKLEIEEKASTSDRGRSSGVTFIKL
jgi:tetratricopeptide (TPR) repeat protein